jgi:hypothetical protein
MPDHDAVTFGSYSRQTMQAYSRFHQQCLYVLKRSDHHMMQQWSRQTEIQEASLDSKQGSVDVTGLTCALAGVILPVVARS